MNPPHPTALCDHLVAALLSARPALLLLRPEPTVTVVLDLERGQRVVMFTVDEGAGPAVRKATFAKYLRMVIYGGPATTFITVGGGSEVGRELKKAKPLIEPAPMAFFHLEGEGDGKVNLAHLGGKAPAFVTSAAQTIDLLAPLDQNLLDRAVAQGQAVADQERAVSSKLKGRYPVTVALIAACLVLHLLSNVWGGPTHTLVLAHMGANRGAALRAGEVYRLFASTFLHLNVTHLAVNMIALWSFGPLLEAILGPRRYLLLYGAAALGGSLASGLLGHDVWSVGASGAIWGLMTGGIALALRPKGLLPASMIAGMRSRAAFPLIINVLYSLQPGIDKMAHFGGGIVGFALMSTVLTSGLVPVVDRPTPADAERHPHAIGTVAAALVAALMGVSVVAALVIQKPWELGAPPVLHRVPVSETGLTIEVPRGMVSRDETTKDGVKIVAFGTLAETPVAFEVVVVKLDHPLVGDEFEAALATLKTMADDNSPPKWTRTAPARIVALGGRRALLVEHDANKEVHVTTYGLLLGGHEAYVRRYATHARPKAWEGVAEKVAASLAEGTP